MEHETQAVASGEVCKQWHNLTQRVSNHQIHQLVQGHLGVIAEGEYADGDAQHESATGVEQLWRIGCRGSSSLICQQAGDDEDADRCNCRCEDKVTHVISERKREGDGEGECSDERDAAAREEADEGAAGCGAGGCNSRGDDVGDEDEETDGGAEAGHEVERCSQFLRPAPQQNANDVLVAEWSVTLYL